MGSPLGDWRIGVRGILCAWLEKEKVELQDMIGEKGWTSGRGEFVLTQEMVDEAIAMYEEILEGIKRGMLYSKTIEGEAETSITISMNPADMWMNTHEAIATSADFTQYASFGLSWDNSEKVLYLNGQRVRYFLDGVEVESYEYDFTAGELRMSWQGKPVHSVFDATIGVWIANSMRGLYLGPDAVDLEAVYEQGKLVGLQETQHLD